MIRALTCRIARIGPPRPSCEPGLAAFPGGHATGTPIRYPSLGWSSRLPFALVLLLAVPGSVGNAEDARPDIFPQLGHRYVMSVAASADGTLMLTGDADPVVRLWDIASGREIRTFPGHTGGVRWVGFSPSGREVLSGSDDKTLRLWDVTSGKLIRLFAGHTGRVVCAAFSRDGKQILSGSEDETLRIWDSDSGQTVKTVSELPSWPTSITLSPDGKCLATGTSGGRVKLRDFPSMDFRKSLLGHIDFIDGLAFLPDGNRILVGSGNEVRIWDVAAGELKTTMKWEYGGNIYSTPVAVFPDGRFAISGSREGVLRVWDLAAGTELRSMKTGSITSVACLPDGRHAVSASWGVVTLWDCQAGKEVREFYGLAVSVSSLKTTRDGKLLLVGTGNGHLTSWDLTAGRMIRTRPVARPAERPEFVEDVCLDISPDETRVATGNGTGNLRVLDMLTFRDVWAATESRGGIESVAFSPDGATLLVGGLGKMLEILDAATGRRVRALEGHTDSICEAMFLPNGRQMLSGSRDKTLRLWDAGSGETVRTLGGDQGQILAVAVSPDGKVVASASEDLTLRLWDIASGQPIRVLGRHSKLVLALAFSHDGERLVSGSCDGEVKVWDVRKEREPLVLRGHVGSVDGVAFSPDSRLVFSAGRDCSLRVWNARTGDELLRLIQFEDGEWVATTPDGYYNSSAGGDRHLNVRVANKVYSIDQYRSTFDQPGVIQAVLELADLGKAVRQGMRAHGKDIPASLAAIEPPFVVIKSPEDGADLKSPEAVLSIYVEDRKRPIESVGIYVNGRKVTRRDDRGVQVVPAGQPQEGAAGALTVPEGQRTVELRLNVALEPGENVIEITASNGAAEARRQTRVQCSRTQGEDQILPNLWVLAIGINRYADKRLPSLNYAVADAESIAASFEKQKGRLFRDIRTRLLTDRSETKPTYSNVVDSLEFLSGAGGQDVVLLFLAGHGMNDDRGAFHFLPADAEISSDGALRKSRAVSWTAVREALDLPAKKIVFIDTCHSEGIGGRKTRSADSDRFVKELQAAHAVIFASSRGSELSQEREAWGHGAFTHAILLGLGGEANLIRDERITMKELDTYVSEKVPELTGGSQHPITFTPDGYVNFPVVLTKP